MGKKIILLQLYFLILSLCCNPALEEKSCISETSQRAVYSEDYPLEENVALDFLSASPGKLWPDFKPDITQYYLTVPAEVSSIEIIAIARESFFAEIGGRSISLNGEVERIPLESDNPININLNNNYGEGKVYSIDVKKMSRLPIENYSFEEFNDQNQPFKWTMTGTGGVVSTNSFAHSGNYSASFASLTSTISGRELMSSAIEINPSKDSILSVWFFLEEVSGAVAERVSVSLKIYYFADKECTIKASTASATMTKISLDEQGQWQRVFYERSSSQIPQDAVAIKVAIRACYEKDAGGTSKDKIFFDDVEVQQ